VSIARKMALLDETAGAVFIGSFISAIMFGVTVTQAMHYYQNYPNDIQFFKISVTLLVLMDIAHVVLIAHGTYMYCIKSIADQGLLQLIPVAFAAQNLLTALSVTLVRCTFARRIWVLSNKNRAVTGFLLLMAGANYAVSLTADIIVFKFKTFEQLAGAKWIIYASFSTDMAADLSIAISLGYFLYRSSRGFKKTSTLLNTLILYVVGTGLVTIMWEAVMIILYTRSRNTLLFFILFLSFSKLYINSLFVSLNFRPSRQSKEGSNSYGSSGGAQPQRVRMPSLPFSRYDVTEFELSPSESKIVSLEVGPARFVGENSAE